jgi:class 3 adenylate cyclase
VSVSEVTLLLTDLDLGETDLYQEMGDARAFGILHEQFRRIDGAVRSAGGAVVKTVGEGVYAAFTDPDAAVRAGLSIPAELGASDLTRGLAPRLRMAAHRGPAMATTINEHLDYFGHTVHEALRALGRTPPGSFVLTRSVASDPQVADQLRALGLGGTVLPDEPASSSFGPLLRIELHEPPSSPPAPRPGLERTEVLNHAQPDTVMIRTR